MQQRRPDRRKGLIGFSNSWGDVASGSHATSASVCTWISAAAAGAGLWRPAGARLAHCSQWQMLA